MATGGIVGNMVCPLCARMHGRPHAEIYQMGYVGAEHQKREVVELMQARLTRVLDVFERAEQDLPRELHRALDAAGLLTPSS